MANAALRQRNNRNQATASEWSSGMTMRLRILIVLTVALGQLFWTSCGHYSCTDTFSPNSCSTGGGGGGGIGTGGGGGGGGSAASAFAFVVDQTLGSIDGYTLTAGTSTFEATTGYVGPAIPTGDPGVGVVVVQKKFLYAVFGPENLIYGWSISSSGTLTTLSGFPVSVPLNGTVPITPYHQVSVITNPSGSLLFIAQALLNQILVFQVSSSGALTAGPPVSTGADSPINLGMDGFGKYLYVTEDPNLSTHTATKTAGYVIGATGTLTAVTGSPFAFPMWQVQGDLSGQYLIGISGNSTALSGVDDLHIYVLAINQTTAPGALTAAAGSPFATTYSPFNLTVNPVGEFAYTFSLNPSDTGNNPTEGFVLNQGTGAISVVPGSPFSNLFAGGNGQFEQSGTYLFSHSGDLSLATSVQLAPLVTSSTGALTQPFSNVTLSTSGYWAVTEPQ
jgi:6-phosphogluconolactonase